MPTPLERARKYLEHKLRETIAECGVPALAAGFVDRLDSLKRQLHAQRRNALAVGVILSVRDQLRSPRGLFHDHRV